jgi:type III pantothenate kinase
VFYTAVDAVDGVVRRIREEWGRPEAFVVATGGFATTVGPHCRTVEHVEPFLTLYGLALAGRHLAGA